MRFLEISWAYIAALGGVGKSWELRENSITTISRWYILKF